MEGRGGAALVAGRARGRFASAPSAGPPVGGGPRREPPLRRDVRLRSALDGDLLPPLLPQPPAAAHAGAVFPDSRGGGGPGVPRLPPLQAREPDTRPRGGTGARSLPRARGAAGPTARPRRPGAAGGPRPPAGGARVPPRPRRISTTVPGGAAGAPPQDRTERKATREPCDL